MFNYIFQMSVLKVFILVSCLSIIISILAVFLVRRFIPIDLRYKDNPVIGNVSALISIIYGVLVGITALFLINNITFIDDAVQREASAVANIYRYSEWFKEPTRSVIQNETKRYLKHVIQAEWPAMRQGKSISNEGERMIDNIANEVRLYSQSQINNAQLAVLPIMMDSIRNLYNARATRIHMTYSALNPEIWLVVLIGTLLTIGINYLFGMNFYLHLISVSVAALMASSMVFLLATLDRPFQGEFVVEADTFKTLLMTVQSDSPQLAVVKQAQH